jgi:hypothetical protein
MHPFPAAAELEFLVGHEIQQVVFDPNSIQFRLADGGNIMVEYRIEHVDEDGRIHPHDCEILDSRPSYLHQLLQSPITAITAETFCLSLNFATGAALRIFSEAGQYECGQIYPPKESGKDIIVF